MTPDGAERPLFHDGQSLTAADLRTEQRYFETLFTGLNQALHLSGIAKGLEVTQGQRPGSLVVSPGVAIDEAGRALILTEARLVDAAGQPGQALFVLLTADERPASPTSESGAVGYKRFLLEPRIELSALGVAQGASPVVLGKVFLDERGAVARVDPRVRQFCGSRAGHVTFASGDAPEDQSPRLEADRSQDAQPVLVASLGRAAFTGVLLVTGTLRVNRDFAHAQLDVESTRERILTVRGDQPALVLDGEGQVGVGVAAPEARLDIAGALRLDAGQALVFEGAGTLRTREGTSSLSFQVSPPRMELSGATLQFQAGTETLPLMLYPNGHATICGAQDIPEATLSVLGRVRVLQGGIRFQDGKEQTTAAISTTVRVGMVIDYWLPKGMKRDLPDNFAICDGSVVNDPHSPLNGVRLPDLRGLFVRGTGDYLNIGQTGGALNHTHLLTQVPVHTHGVGHNHGWYRGSSSESLGEPDSDATDDKLTGFHHQHSVEIRVDETDTTTSKENSGLVNPGMPLQSADNLPPYYGLVKLMRIR
ncbi:hypothetical protein D7W79_09785 [Corallococcus exercitus]|uniref:hypothetical protein n=1 Tax=Corallococcus exercitus TaxID=2316736 RepID=UPI000EA2DC10|nr:hypothetical protein [Corallococcus exercitus]RKG79682.1 hypothetical protein D7W79_09785 [Corallococcus exercitus]